MKRILVGFLVFAALLCVLVAAVIWYLLEIKELQIVRGRLERSGTGAVISDPPSPNLFPPEYVHNTIPVDQ